MSSCKTDIDEDFKFTDTELEVYQKEKEKMFKGTIAICVIYAIIAIILLSLGYFTEIGKQFIFNTLLPFTVVFIIGTIIIIIYFADKVNNYKPKKIDNRIKYDQISCPDYWNLVELGQEELAKFSTQESKNLFRYKCEMNDKVYKKDVMAGSNGNYKVTNKEGTPTLSGTDKLSPEKHLYINVKEDRVQNDMKKAFKEQKDFKPTDIYDVAMYMNQYEKPSKDDKTLDDTKYVPSNYYKNTTANATLNDGFAIDNAKESNLITTYKDNKVNYTVETANDEIPLVCDTVYPLYLADKDGQYSYKNKEANKNTYRCAYAKACGVPWTEANC